MRPREEYMAMAGLGDYALPGIGDGKRIRKDSDGQVQVPPHVRTLPIGRMGDLPEPQPREWLLEGVVPMGAATSVFATGGSAKSLLVLDLAISCARGADRWLGRDLMGCAALYLDFELTSDEQRRRASLLAQGAGLSGLPDELFYLSAVGSDAESAFWSGYAACQDQGIGLVVVDSYGLAMEGEMNANKDVLEFFRNMIEPFIVEGIAVLIVDHPAKGGDRYQDKSAYGSTFKRNTVRSELQLEKVESYDYRRMELILRHTKSNFGPILRPFGAEVEFGKGEIRVGPRDLSNRELAQEDGTKATDRVLLAMEELEDQATVKTIADFTGMNYKTVVMATNSLKHRGAIKETSRRVGGAVTLESIGTGNAVVWYA